MVRQARAHILSNEVATGAGDTKVFNLEPGTRLMHAAISVAGGVGPLRVNVTVVQPRVNSSVFMDIIGGWARGFTPGPSGTSSLTWDGDMEIGTEMAIQLLVRNDTGSTQVAFLNFLVME